MLNHLIQSYQSHSHQLTGKRIWLACSGGRDSMALAFAMHQLYLQDKLPFCPQLIHVNHGLQSANDDWESLVHHWANSLNLPCYTVKANLAMRNNTNELAARLARYQAMMNLMNQGDVLLLAHHANDQAETMLMRLFNGAGITGLASMSEWATKSISCPALSNDCVNPSTEKQVTSIQKTITLWRPWLNIKREQISDYAQHQQLPYVDDPTNLEGDNIRSWLRSELFPSITKQYPQAIQSIARSAELCTDAESILAEVYQQDLQCCHNATVSTPPYDLVLDIEQIKRLSHARQRQLIHKWLQGDEPIPASKQRIDEILTLVNRQDNNQQAQFDWQGKYHHYSIRRYRQHLHRLRSDWLALLISNDIWQTQLGLKQQQAIKEHFPQVDYRIRPLERQDKFAFTDQQTAKSGKKLLQMLGIPSWERPSLKVVLIHHTEQQQIPPDLDRVMAVVSPRQLWVTTKLPNYQTTKLEDNLNQD